MAEYRILGDDVDTLQTFVEESSEYLQSIEKSLLLIETAGETSTHLNDIFRNIHTIKGLSSFVEITEVTAFCHEAESMLDGLRKNNFQLTPEIITLLLDCCDILAEMFLAMSNVCRGYCNGDLVFTLNMPGKMARVKAEISEVLSVQPSSSQKIQGIPTDDAGISAADEALLTVVKGQASGTVLESFLSEADEHTDILGDQLLIRLDGDRDNTEVLADIFRRIHTLKGLLGVVLSVEIDDSYMTQTVRELQAVFHSTETMLERVRSGELTVTDRVINLCFAAVDGLKRFAKDYRRGCIDHSAVLEQWRTINSRGTDRQDKGMVPKDRPQQTERSPEPSIALSHSIRVSEEKLDRLMGIVGEMAIGKNAFFQIANKLMMDYNLPAIAREVREAGQWVARMSSDLEDSVMGIRMTEVKALFQKFPRVVRDIALQTEKKISLVMEGEDTELDKTIIEQIGDPLMHLVRNAADHGIESVAARQEAGKDIQGRVTLRAYSRGKHVVIEVEDDGRGMDPVIIRAKAVEKGFITEEQARQLSDHQTLQLIFLPGFSTAKAVSEISGRGVGMDVVKTNVAALKGSIAIDSVLGRGSRVTIQLPLTLVVSRGLLVEVGRESLVVPLEYVAETVKVPRDRVLNRQGKLLFYHRGDVMGVISLGDLLEMECLTDQAAIPIILVTDGKSRIGLAVDRLRNEMDVLVKPLPEFLSSIQGMGGATILGDGRVALVLNPVEIIRMATGG